MSQRDDVKRMMDEVAAEMRKLAETSYVGTPPVMTFDVPVPVETIEVELTIEGEDEQ